MAPESTVASMLPDDMMPGGLPDKFSGTILKARFAPWNYNGSIDHDVLAVAVTYKPDAGQDVPEEPFTQHYSAGDLDHFRPSMDGKNPVDPNGDGEELEGVYAIKVGKRDQLTNNTNWAHWMREAIKAGFPVKEVVPNLEFLTGVRGFFTQIPQQKRSGIQVQAADEGDAEGGKQRRGKTILVMERYEGREGGAATTKGAAASRPSPTSAAGKSVAQQTAEAEAASATNGEASPIDSRLHDVVLEALRNNNGSLKKVQLGGLVVSSGKFTGADKNAAIRRVANTEFLSAFPESWFWDKDSAELTQLAE